MENHFSGKHISHGLTLGPTDYSVILNWTYGSSWNVSSDSFHESAVDTRHPTLSSLGVVTATVVAFLLSSLRTLDKIKHVQYQNVLHGFLIMVGLLLTVPLLVILALYRSAVFCLLKIGSFAFISLMEGPDAVWNLKDPSQPIITVLAEVEAEKPECLLNAIQEAILKAVLFNPKLTWRRMYSPLGFSYWEMCSDFSSLREHVRWMQHDKQNMEDYITLSELQILISDIAHHPLHEDNACWEILVSRKRLMIASEESRMVYPVLFRIHHSLGDGVSLLELLLNSLSAATDIQHKGSYCLQNLFTLNKENINVKENDNLKFHNNSTELKGAEVDSDARDIHKDDWENLQKLQRRELFAKNIEQKKYKRGITEVFVSKGKIRFGSSQAILLNHKVKTLFSSLENNIHFLASIVSNLQIMQTLICSLKEIRESCEISILDASKISGKKIVAWYTDSPQGYVFSAVKRIKSEVKGVRFTDVILTALSTSIQRFLKERNAYVPNCMSVVVPIYTEHYFNTCMEKMKSSMTDQTMPVVSKTSLKSDVKAKYVEDFQTAGNLKLKNSFSLGVLNLPVKTEYTISHISHLKNVAQHMNFMHKSGQLALNSFILKWIANLFPEPLLNKFLQLTGHNTMVVSNLIGPTEILFLAGYPLRNIYFWVPQRGNTGISVSILSYCNRLQLGVMVDSTIINTAEEVQHFVNEVVKGVTHLRDESAHKPGNGALMLNENL